MSVIRLLVCGGRSYADRECLERTLDAVHRKHAIEVLIHGACHLGGADRLADEWAVARGVPVQACPVEPTDGQWPAAGPIRNKRMLEVWQPSHGVAFPTKGEKNKGTRDMTRQFNAWPYKIAPMWVVES